MSLYRRIGQASCPDFGHREISNGITTFDQLVERVMTPPAYGDAFRSFRIIAGSRRVSAHAAVILGVAN